MTLLGDSYCEYGSGLTSGQPTQSDGSNLQQAKLLAAVRRLHFKMNLPFRSLKTGKLVTCEKQALEPITTTCLGYTSGKFRPNHRFHRRSLGKT
jgi:hypothetical protein